MFLWAIPLGLVLWGGLSAWAAFDSMFGKGEPSLVQMSNEAAFGMGKGAANYVGTVVRETPTYRALQAQKAATAAKEAAAAELIALQTEAAKATIAAAGELGTLNKNVAQFVERQGPQTVVTNNYYGPGAAGSQDPEEEGGIVYKRPGPFRVGR